MKDWISTIKNTYAKLRGNLRNRLLLAFLDGIVKGLKTGFFLLKIMVPIYLVVVLIKYSPVMPWLQELCTPAMGLFHLPGDAVVPMVTGIFTDEYGVVAAMGSFDFSVAAATTIAMFVLTAHSLPVEAAIAQKIGLPPIRFLIFRLVMAVIVAIFIGWLGGVLL